MELMTRIASEDNLHDAWRRVRANRGGPGTDAVCLTDFEADLPERLDALRRSLLEETYVPLALRRASVPKSGGRARELAIPAVTDRVAQRAFVNVLEGVFEPLFLPCSFGFRPARGVAQAVEAVLAHRAAGFGWIVDADVQDFFRSVDHALLRERLREHISDRAVLRTLGLWLEAGALARGPEARVSLLAQTAVRVQAAAREIMGGGGDGYSMDEDDLNAGSAGPLLRHLGAEAARLAWDNRRTWLPLLATRGAMTFGGAGLAVLGVAALGHHLTAGQRVRPSGTPQGGPISPLLSNVYLHAFDTRMTQAGLRLVRYADDFVICCASEARARQARAIAETELSRLRLRLHPEKTCIVPCADALRFLGYEFDRDGAFPVPKKEEADVLHTAQQAAVHAGQSARKGLTSGMAQARRHTQEIRQRVREAKQKETRQKGNT